MTKKTQGFSSQGGGPFRAARGGPHYSDQELQALSKIGGDDLRGGPDGRTVALCNLCGKPIVGMAFSGKDYVTELKRGVHEYCNNLKIKQDQDQYEALPDDEKARLFNEDPGAATAAPIATKLEPYRPKPGELSLDKIQARGGLSAIPEVKDPEDENLFKPISEEMDSLDPAERARLEADQKRIEAEQKAELEAAGLLESTVPPKKAKAKPTE